MGVRRLTAAILSLALFMGCAHMQRATPQEKTETAVFVAATVALIGLVFLAGDDLNCDNTRDCDGVGDNPYDLLD